MKTLSKVLAIMLAVVFCCSAVGCAGTSGGLFGKDPEKEVDYSKTQLYIGNYNGGCGEEWVETLGARFEEAYADYSFEEGKKGVQVWYDHDKIKYLGDNVTNNIDVTDRDVIFCQGVEIFNFMNGGGMSLLDITDIVTSDLTDMGDTGTIADKLSDWQKNYYCVDGKYYALPCYNGFLGIVYDVDLFDSKGFYFDADGKLGATLSDARSTGPDGVTGTYDDGLPATYDQFYELCDYMKKKNITPMIWSGQYRDTYTSYILDSIRTDYEGADKVGLQFNAGIDIEDNLADIITSIADDGTVTLGQVAISKDNYENIVKQPGRYYALKFLETIVNNKYYSTLSMDDAESHVMAQADYLESVMSGNRIAMICEGTWWQAEAGSVFEDMAAINTKYAVENRRFGFMPMPKVDEDHLGKPTLHDGTSSMMLISGSIDASKQKVAKMFVQFANTQQSIQEFSVITGGVRAMKCDYTDVMDQLSYWTKGLVSMKENSDVHYAVYTSKEAKDFVAAKGWSFIYSTVGSMNESTPVNAMVYRNVSAKDFFEGYYKYLTSK